MDPLLTEQDLDRLRMNASAYAVLIAWSQQGLFDQLAQSESLSATALNGDTNAIRNTAPVLAHLGLLIRHPPVNGPAAWSLSRSARKLMESGVLPIPQHFAGFDNLTRVQGLLERGGPVRDREGKSRLTSGGVVEDNRQQTQGFMDMLFRRSAESAVEIARLLAPRIQAGNALDLGGGHGRYGHELAKRGFRVTLFDRQVCCEIAAARYGDTLQTRSGDFMTDDLGGPYDLILLSNIVHGCGPDELALLFPRLRQALMPGGLLAIKDMFLDDAHAGPEPAALFGLTMLMYTARGRSHARSEMRTLLADAGFDDVCFVDVLDQHFSLLMAT
jgi:hypothetical protein